MIYCSTVWHFCKSSDSRKLERVQERALRAVYCDWTSTYEQLLSLANLPTLLNRRLQDIAILMYKVKHNICPTYICDLFSKNQCPYNIRVKEFVIPRVSTVNHGKHVVWDPCCGLNSLLKPGLHHLYWYSKKPSEISNFQSSSRNVNAISVISNFQKFLLIVLWNCQNLSKCTCSLCNKQYLLFYFILFLFIFYYLFIFFNFSNLI